MENTSHSQDGNVKCRETTRTVRFPAAFLPGVTQSCSNYTRHSKVYFVKILLTVFFA